MTLDLTIAKTEALFASTLSACEPHDRAEVRAAIAVRGCAGVVAQAFGGRPEQAVERMQWARREVASC